MTSEPVILRHSGRVPQDGILILSEPPQRQRYRRRGLTRVDVIALLIVSTVVVALVLAMLARTARFNARVTCAENLRQIGQAILVYCNDNRGTFPRTRTPVPHGFPKELVLTWGTRAAATQPFADDGPELHDVTASIFLLLRTTDINSTLFVCPATNTHPDDFAGHSAQQRSNFTNWRRNLSYSFLNPFPDWRWYENSQKRNLFRRHPLGGEFPIFADMNPGAEALKPTPSSPPQEMRLGNSRNHRRAGQNVLYHDGHVSWRDTPFAGVNGDNIFTTADGRIVASPVDASDVVLLPPADAP